jgi:hypothetical protein
VRPLSPSFAFIDLEHRLALLLTRYDVTTRSCQRVRSGEHAMHGRRRLRGIDPHAQPPYTEDKPSLRRVRHRAPRPSVVRGHQSTLLTPKM